MKFLAATLFAASAAAIRLSALQERECADNRPTFGTEGTITIEYYWNENGGSTGDDCDACIAENYLNQNTFWANADADYCTTWPGHSGENSITNGRCIADQGFSIDQRTTCDCSGNITTKEAFVGKCVVDKPQTMCALIVDYSGCEALATDDAATEEEQTDKVKPEKEDSEETEKPAKEDTEEKQKPEKDGSQKQDTTDSEKPTKEDSETKQKPEKDGSEKQDTDSEKPTKDNSEETEKPATDDSEQKQKPSKDSETSSSKKSRKSKE